jgi:hypothetical protein
MCEHFCPNLQSCKFINSGVPESVNRGNDFYLTAFCRSENSNWKNCKRFQTKSILDFCPDFIVPDSPWTMDQIIDKVDKENTST